MIDVKNIFSSITRIKKLTQEEQFYKQLFINNPTWNKPDPNDDELLRWQIIEKLLSRISHLKLKNTSNEKFQILDLGCGRGWLTNLLSHYGNITGIEPIKDVVTYSKKLFPKLKIIHGTSQTLINSKNFTNYDLIVSSEVIEHIPDSEKLSFVHDIKLLLKKKGYLIITTPRKDVEEQWKKYADPNQPVEEWMSEFQVNKLFVDAGFTKIQIERGALAPVLNAPLIEIYQLWLFQIL